MSALPCTCPGFTEATCLCTAQERLARQLAYGHADAPPLSAETRQDWAEEIASFEAQPPASELVRLDDKSLARALLGAWMDYLRDKGLRR